MNKRKAILVSFLILAGIIAILAWNKSKMTANTEVETIADIPVVVTTPTRQQLSDAISLVGTTAANNDVAVASETMGKVTQVFVNVGDHVSAGSPLVKVDDELRRAGFATSEVNYTKAKRDLERYEALHKDSTVSDAQIEAARLNFKAAEAQYITAQRQLNDTKICSPISGIVTSRTVDIGTMIQNGMIIANVVDISRLKVKVSVAEKDIFTMKPGDPVRMTTDVYPGITFDGTVKTLSAKGDEMHTYPVEISLPNSAQHPLRAGMFARVTFTAKTAHEALVIPRNALTGSVKQPQVFVIENNAAKLVPITLGAESETFVEVLNGLNGDENIVTEGKNNLKDGFKVSVSKSVDKNGN